MEAAGQICNPELNPFFALAVPASQKRQLRASMRYALAGKMLCIF
jgi:hypothetical protein